MMINHIAFAYSFRTFHVSSFAWEVYRIFVSIVLLQGKANESSHQFILDPVSFDAVYCFLRKNQTLGNWCIRQKAPQECLFYICFHPKESNHQSYFAPPYFQCCWMLTILSMKYEWRMHEVCVRCVRKHSNIWNIHCKQMVPVMKDGFSIWNAANAR